MLVVMISFSGLHGFVKAAELSDHAFDLGLEEEIQSLEEEGTAHANDPDKLLRLAGLYLDLGYGVYSDRDKKLAAFQRGAHIAQKALALREMSADAHFLYAANLGSAVELQGLVTGAMTIQQIKTHVRRALELDERHVSAHHMLGRMYEDLPWFLGGDQVAAEKHLKKAISLDLRYAPARLDLAKSYVKHGKISEAVKELTFLINTPSLTKRWLWDRIYRPEAQALLNEIILQEGDSRLQAAP